MKSIQLDSPEQPLDKFAIDEFEISLGMTLPGDFIDFYLTCNGGYPPYNYVAGETYLFAIDGFFPIKYGSLTIEQLLRDYRKQGIFFAHKIPFASDPGGNIFFLSVDPATLHHIYLWESQKAPHDPGSYTYVCRSFSHFIDALTNDDDREGMF